MKTLSMLLALQLILTPVMGYAQTAPNTALQAEDTYYTVGTGSDEGLSTLINGALMTGSAVVGPGLLTCEESSNETVVAAGEDGSVSTYETTVKASAVNQINLFFMPLQFIGFGGRVGIITSGFQRNTIPTFSHYIFMGGAVALLASEIQGALLHKKFLEQQEKEMERMQAFSTTKEQVQNGPRDNKGKLITTKEQADAQMEALRISLQGEINHKELLQKRLNWLKAVEVIYWLAVTGAVVETVLYALTKVPAYGSSIGYYNWKMTCNSSKLTAATSAGLMAAYKVIPSAVKGDWKGAGMGAAGAGISFFALGEGQNFISKMVDKGINLGMSSAPARIVTFGLFGGLSSLNRGQYSKKVDKTKKNISVLEKAIADWKNTAVASTEIIPGAGGAGSGEGSGDDLVRGQIGGNGSLNPLATGVKPVKYPCISSSNGSVTANDTNCSNPMKFTNTKFDLKSPYLNGVAKDAMNMATLAASGDMAGAEVAAQGLAAHAARVKKEAKALMAKAEKTIKENGGGDINFEKEIEKGMQTFQQEAAAQLKKDFNNLASANNEAAKLAENSDAEKSSDVEINKANAQEVAQPNAKSLDFGLDSNYEDSNSVAAVSGKAEQSFDEFETNEEDINKKSDVSIFKQVSNRYLLNYTKIFEDRSKKEIKN